MVLRGWCSWDEVKTKGVRREEEVVPFMTELFDNMPESYRKHSGKFRLFGARNVKVYLPVTPGMAWELRTVAQDAVERGSLTLGDVTPRIMVEDSPQDAATKVVMGRLIDTTKTAISQKGLICWTVEPDWRAKHVKIVSSGQ